MKSHSLILNLTDSLVLRHSTQNDLLIGTVPDVPQTSRVSEHSIFASHMDAHRGTSPTPHTNPIGFERGLSHQLDHRDISNLRISSGNTVDAQSFGINTGDYMLPRSNQQGDDNIEPPIKVKEQCSRDFASPSESVGYLSTYNDNSTSADTYQRDGDKFSGTKFIDPQIGAVMSHMNVAPRHHPQYYSGVQKQGQAMYDGAASVYNRGLGNFPAEAQYQHNQVLVRGMKDAPVYQDQAPDNNVMKYGHYPYGTNEGIGTHNLQGNEEIYLTNGHASIGRDFAVQNPQPTHGLTQPTETRVSPDSTVRTDIVPSSNNSNSPRSNFTQMNDILIDGQRPRDKAVALIQAGFNPTRQLLREIGLIAPISADNMSASRYVGDHIQLNHRDQVGGSLGLPDHLNCAVWIQGISKGIDKLYLHRELFRAVSIGPIVGAHIKVADSAFSNHAAKVIFKHPEHAGRLVYIAKTLGIKINGKNIRIEPNRFGYREHPLSLHYQSRVVIVRVKNNPNLGLSYWLNFVKALCVVGIESTRHLDYSTPKMMVMEFRFARIVGQAQVLLQGIKNCPEFRGNVSARYVPDVVCDLHHK